MLCGPDRERATDEFRPVIADDPVRSGSHRDELREHGGNGLSRERRVHRHREGLARTVIGDVEQPKHAAGRERVAHEVHRPSRVRPARGLVRDARARQFPTAALAHIQTGVSVDALNALVIVGPALALQLPREQRRAPPWMIAGKLLEALPQRAVAASSRGDVARRCPMHGEPAAGATLSDGGAFPDRGDRTAPLLGSLQSFLATSFSTWIFSG
jgi:hypothetical protein